MNYWIQKIDSDGTLDELKDNYFLNHDATKSCGATEPVSRRLLSSNSNNNDGVGVGGFSNKITDTTESSSVVGNRIIKNSTNRRLQSSVNYATSNDSDPSNTWHFWPDEALTLKQMAGTFLLHAVLSVFSIMIGILSRLMENRRNKNKGGNNEENGRGHRKKEDELSEQDLSGTPSLSSVQTQIKELQLVQTQMLSTQDQMLSTQNQILLMLKNMQDK